MRSMQTRAPIVHCHCETRRKAHGVSLLKISKRCGGMSRPCHVTRVTPRFAGRSLPSPKWI